MTHDSTANSTAPYVVISADCHAGADLRAYRPYLEQRRHAEFDEWATAFADPWAEIDPDPSEFKVGVASAGSSLNWDSARRLGHLEDDGICAEVIFPNTAPPFFPTGVFTAAPPATRSEYERRWAGLRAHNRWLADFCNDAPGRRAGVAQVFLNDVEDTIAEVKWAKAAGLTGGILLPADSQTQLAPLYYETYEPLWAVCAELGVPVHRHAAIPGDATVPGDAAASAIGLIEGRFFSHRALGHLIFAGVFERHPNLRFVFTETGLGWVPSYLRELDAMYESARTTGTFAQNFAGPAATKLPRTPSEYFATNCFIGASFMSAAESAIRHEVGVDRIMWGSDYPHIEGTYPFSREALQVAFADVPVAETRQILTDTPATIYDFDVAALQSVADRIGPTPEQIQAAPTSLPHFPDETRSPAFAGALVTGHFQEA